MVHKDILGDTLGILVYEALNATQPEAAMRTFHLCIAAITLAASPALAFECPVGKGASIYGGAPGGILRAEPRADAPVVAKFKGGTAAVAVLEVASACRLPKGWVRADVNGKSGYIRETELRPRARPGMPE
jgi:hypothetical protein